jgi:hypothetical protein
MFRRSVVSLPADGERRLGATPAQPLRRQSDSGQAAACGRMRVYPSVACLS